MNEQPHKKQKERPKDGRWSVIFAIIASLALLGFLSNSFFGDKSEPEEITYYQFVEMMKEEGSKKDKQLISLEETSTGDLNITIGEDDTAKTYVTSVNPRESGLTDILKEYDVNYTFVVPFQTLEFISQFVILLFFILIIWFFIVPMLKGGQFGGSAGKKLSKVPDITFDDIGGLSPETKREIFQTQEIINNPEQAKELGIKPSKGIILYGPSGTGKTLIAKAVANSFQAEFISASGSDFVEMFAGLGARRVRELFEKAKKSSPAVIFIDEIDAVARKRSSNAQQSGGDNEREQTLNQILVNLDGVDELKDVLVIAATNRLDILDDALLRPGRFDFKIKIDLPDVDGRKEIIQIHTKKKPLSEEVKERLDEIAKSTVGFSGADLEAVFDNAAFHAFGQKRSVIEMEDVNHGLDRIVIGSATRKIGDEQTRERVAYHEAGHAVVSSLLNPNSVRKVTIIPRGGALGYVAQIPKEGIHDIDSLKNILRVMVAGGVAEDLIYGNHSNGVSDDFKRAKQLTKQMIEDWGMGSNTLVPSFGEKEANEEMKKLYISIIQEAKKIISDNREMFDKVTQLLLEKETIDGQEIERLKDESSL